MLMGQYTTKKLANKYGNTDGSLRQYFALNFTDGVFLSHYQSVNIDGNIFFGIYW